jgi:RNA-directed DNA polymerase
VNIDEPISAEELWAAGQRVLKIQTKLHQWASDEPSRVFADLFNLVTDRRS